MSSDWGKKEGSSVQSRNNWMQIKLMTVLNANLSVSSLLRIICRVSSVALCVYLSLYVRLCAFVYLMSVEFVQSSVNPSTVPYTDPYVISIFPPIHPPLWQDGQMASYVHTSIRPIMHLSINPYSNLFILLFMLQQHKSIIWSFPFARIYNWMQLS